MHQLYRLCRTRDPGEWRSPTRRSRRSGIYERDRLEADCAQQLRTPSRPVAYATQRHGGNRCLHDIEPHTMTPDHRPPTTYDQYEPGTLRPYGPCTNLLAGDGALLPPRFDGDPKTDVTDWAIDFEETLRRIHYDDTVLILRKRLAGTTRVRFESIPKDRHPRPSARTLWRDRVTRQSSEFWSRQQGAPGLKIPFLCPNGRVATRAKDDLLSEVRILYLLIAFVIGSLVSLLWEMMWLSISKLH